MTLTHEIGTTVGHVAHGRFFCWLLRGKYTWFLENHMNQARNLVHENACKTKINIEITHSHSSN